MASNTESAERPTHGIRVSQGVVTHFNAEPITSRTMAEHVRQLIQETTGEDGEITEVIVAPDARPVEHVERLHRESE